jgi:hypothetical protein
MKPNHYWTEEEEEIIRKHYRKGDEYLHKLLPHRTIKAIASHRILKLRINPTSKFWDDSEEETKCFPSAN